MRSGGVSDALRAPAPGQEFVDALGGMIRQAAQHVGELSLWIEVVELGRGMRVIQLGYTGLRVRSAPGTRVLSNSSINCGSH